jgi:1-acyl-sn-glycerol-3-phosphate acyltransferase
LSGPKNNVLKDAKYYNGFFRARLSADLIDPANKILGITYVIHGTENIDKKKAYVVVCNHQSSLDVLAALQVPIPPNTIFPILHLFVRFSHKYV